MHARPIAWLTWPAFMTLFMGSSWWCFRAGFDPEVWIPALTTLNFLVILGLEQVLPRRPEMNTLRDWQSINDALHGALTGLLRPVGTSIGLLLLAALAELRLRSEVAPLWPGGSWLVAQLLLAHAIVSLASYWVHRAFHEIDRLWWFHAIHHDTQQVHVLKSGRFHFLDELVSALLTPLPLLALGAPTEVIVLRSMWSVFSGSMGHANVEQRFPSWFHYLVSTVDVHNLHHCRERRYQDSNYTGMPLWDVLFGTFHHPDLHRPVAFGIADGYVPRNFFRQLWFPFEAQWRRPLPAEACVVYGAAAAGGATSAAASTTVNSRGSSTRPLASRVETLQDPSWLGSRSLLE
jgi:sterol desaturase/sphingolipid hydroxylase (fatty acid hydroxylase superfamily)